MANLIACATVANLLFLGNSFTLQNDLDVKVRTVLEEDGSTISSARLAMGGWRFADHLAATNGGNPAWVDALGPAGPAWDWVFLQEQSQIPGFPPDEPSHIESVGAGGELDDLAEARGAETVAVLTWGYREGDATNAWLFPDFPTMQDRLLEGTIEYDVAWSSPSRPVWVAPAGLAFRAVWDRIQAAGNDPLDAASDFSVLYSGDGRHPAPAGTWLAAWTLYATMTGCSPVGHPLPADLDPDLALRLQADAATAVFGGMGGIEYPWSATGDDDDSAGDDDSLEDDDSGDDDDDMTGDDDSGGDVESAGDDDSPFPATCGPQGCCACSTGAEVLPGLLPLLAVPLLYRPRRHPRQGTFRK
jgi:hypothetical protein